MTKYTVLIVFILFSSFFILYFSTGFAEAAYIKAPPSPMGPVVNDPTLVVEKVNDKPLNIPTSMAFLGNNDILVTEKETGKVIRVLNGIVQDENPLLDVDVATAIERGLLGIAISKTDQNPDGKTYVFIYYTESGGGKDGDDVSNNVDPAGNRLYRYEYQDGKLVNPVLLLDLPATPENDRGEHNGGKVLVGPDKNVYLVIGEVGAHRTQAQNVKDGPKADGTGGVLRITQDGKPVPGITIFGDKDPLNLYYAIGIRNSFGIDFDPVTRTLWDTENGPTAGDEVNMVEPGFNSGWVQIQGMANRDTLGTGATVDDLVTLGNSKYRDPEFTWGIPVGVTDAKFLNSDLLGKQYQNNLFVGDIDNGIIFRFILNQQRNGIDFTSKEYGGDLQALADKEANTPREMAPLIFGQGFGGITDLDVGPDGYLYVLTYFGDLYRIMPKSASVGSDNNGNIVNQQNAKETIPQSESNDQKSNTNTVKVNIVGVDEGDKSYSPNPVRIEKGQTVTWINGDVVSHTVTSGSPDDTNAGKDFDSKSILPGLTYSLTFDKRGTYEYFCFYHPSMIGEIIVK